MTGFWIAAGEWWAHAAVAGGAVLLLGWAAGRLVAAPACRHRMGAWSVRGAVLAAGLCALPAWLVLPAPGWVCADGSTRAPSGRCVPTPPADPVPATATAGPAQMVMARPTPDPRRPRSRFDSEWLLFEQAERKTVTDTAPLAITVEQTVGVVDSPEPAAVPTPTLQPTDPQPAPEPTTTVVSEDAVAWRAVLPLMLVSYFAVSAVLLLQLVLGHLVLVRLAWLATPLRGKARWVFDRLTEDDGGSGVRAYTSDAVPSPVCFGFARPTILLPTALAESVGEDELRWVLAHELDHVRRGDHRTAYWVGLARAVFFFVPWFWPLRKSIGLNQEFLADAAAAGAGGRPVDYAAFLVNLSGTPLERRLARPSLASTGVRAGKSDLFRRVTMLLNSGSNLDRRVPRGFAVVAGAGVLATAVGLSGIGFAAQPPVPPTDPVEVPVRVQVAVEPPEQVPVRVEVVVEQPEPPEPPAKPQPPVKPEVVKELRAKIEKAIEAGKADEARDLLRKLEKAVQPPPPPAPAKAPKPPAVVLQPVQPVPGVPGVPAAPRVVGPRGDWAPPIPPEPPVAVWNVGGQNNWVAQAADADLKKQYEKQLKDFDKAIKDAKDDDARDQLTKARDEYKKAMEEAVKKADVAKADVEKARKDLNKALEQNRLQFDMGQKRMMDLQLQLQERLMKEFPKELEQFQQLFPKEFGQFGNMRGFELPPGAFGGQFQPFAVAGAPRPRFGAFVEKIPPAMVEQLNLEKDAGILVTDVVPGTVADKLKLKKNDVLLRFAGKDIPADPDSFVTMVGNVKGGEKIEVTVLRKGKKETFKDVVLPDAKETNQPGARAFGGGLGGGLNPGGLGGGLAVAGGGGFDQMSIQINNDDVTVTANKDGVSYAINGQMDGGKMKADKITVTDSKDTKTYESVDKVPEKHRDAVNKLLGRFRGK